MVKSTTTIVDGVVAGSRLLVCTVPPVADGTTAVVTLEWSGGQAVPLYKAFDGANKLYSATWYAPPLRWPKFADTAGHHLRTPAAQTDIQQYRLGAVPHV